MLLVKLMQYIYFFAYEKQCEVKVMDGFLPKKQIQIWILEEKEKLDFMDSSLLLF